MSSPAHHLTKLDPFAEDDVLRMVVETPRGASVKLTYDPGLGKFTVARSLALRITYPFEVIPAIRRCSSVI